MRAVGEQAACVFCGEGDPWAVKKTQRAQLEEHHSAGEASDANTTAFTCLNCHRKVTERLNANGSGQLASARHLTVGPIQDIAVDTASLVASEDDHSRISGDVGGFRRRRQIEAGFRVTVA